MDRFIENKGWHYFAAFLSGMALVFTFSPANIFILAFVSPAILLWLLIYAKPTRAAWLGFTFGMGFFGVGISWVFVSIYVFGGTPEWAAALITLLFVIVLAQFFTFLGYGLQKYFPRNNYTKLLLVYPALWALLEAFRSWIFTGFPWLLLGHTVAGSILSGLAPVLGSFGCSYYIVFVSSLLLIAATPNLFPHQIWRPANWALAGLIITIAIGCSLRFIEWTKPVGRPLSVALVQGNILQSLRWDPQEVDNILNNYRKLSQNYWSSDLIVWPEAAIPLDPIEAKPFLEDITQQLNVHHSALITGIPLVENKRYYNAVIGLGQASGEYRKRHLVPFGEYVPFQNYLRGLFGFLNLPMSNFLAGSLSQPLIMAKGIPLGVFVCYEIAYDHLLRQDIPKAQLLVTVSDDAWFGNSFAPWQHLEIGQFQAAVAGRPMLFVGNDGITAVIDAHGTVTKAIPQFQAEVLTDTVMPRQGITPWMKLGDITWILLMIVGVWIGYKHNRAR